MTTRLVWNAGDHNMTCRLDWLDEANTDETIRRLEAAAGRLGRWDDDGWWGVHGTFDGKTFTVYTHKSGVLKIGGHPDEGLDLAGLKAALLSL